MCTDAENRRAIEALQTAFEALAINARAKWWPADTIADAAFRASVSLCMAEWGVGPTAAVLAHLAEDLTRLARLTNP